MWLPPAGARRLRRSAAHTGHSRSWQAFEAHGPQSKKIGPPILAGHGSAKFWVRSVAASSPASSLPVTDLTDKLL
jgi:hypothetical protein